ncbi:MAG: ferritin family protein [Desulfobacterales bacterium]
MQDERLAGLIATAIRREEEAYDFYMGIHAKVRDGATRDTIAFVANEEKKHKAFLVHYRDGDFAADAMRMSDVVFYKIAEYQEEPEIKENIDSEEVFLLAAHRELRSHGFYTELANLHPSGNTKDMLLRMANEELKHKEKMEYLYANTAFPQTSGG